MRGQNISNIEKLRLAKGLTQEQVAKSIGVSRPTYINIENGIKELTVSQAEMLAAVLRVNVEDLLDTTDGVVAFSDSKNSFEKFKQIVLNALKYGADDDGKITKTKLAKLVYLADFIWFYENSKPLTGVKYRKMAQGPVPYEYFRALDEMEEEGIIIREQKGKAIMFSLAEKQAPTGKLTKDEVKIVEKVGKAWKGKPTTDIVNFTHEQLPWQICMDEEVIPYGLIFQEEPEKIYGPVQI
ncbi:DUF4065 domain-containing protein [Candidatus Saccharibacteria bacterium]|nr:DUF4065 domain-containing protein [Candidatus Saccharibacteria bacterium]